MKLAAFLYWISTCGLVGRSPFAPGTLASLLAAGFVFALSTAPPAAYLAATVVLTMLAVWASNEAQEVLGVKDPRMVVIDEVVGMFLTFLFIPLSPTRLAAGFVLFRFFDILKPFPIRSSERLPGGFGIVADDALAALYSNLLLRFLICHAKL